jgi:8-oxo-dGTP pyrophosphatase MutT (NUDIX family)
VSDHSEPLADEPQQVDIVSSEVVYDGRIWNVRRDEFAYGDSTIAREYVDHTGAVAVLAIDDDDRVLLIRQYRHPIRTRDWEIPAGLLDITGESPLVGARRELAEEADVAATDWSLLCDFFTSPGGSNEAIRVYLARGLSETPAFAREEEEAQLEKRWVDLDELVDAVLERRVGNSILCLAALTAHASRARGWSSLGDAESAWPRHPKSREQSREYAGD